MQKTYCDDCGREVPVSKETLRGRIKLGHTNRQVNVEVRFANRSDKVYDIDLCPDCAVSIVQMLRDKPEPPPEPEKKPEPEPQAEAKVEKTEETKSEVATKE